MMCISGASARYFAVGLLELQPGDEIITSPLTLSTDIAPMLRAGLAPVFADLSSEAACIELSHQITRRESKLDILVNNAGANWGEDYASFPEKAWDRVLDLNLKAPFS